MEFLAFVATGIVSWSVLSFLYFLARGAGFVETVIVAEFPLSASRNETRVKWNLAFHLLNACFFTLLYASAWSLIGVYSRPDFLSVALLTGLIHGVAAAIGLIVLYSGRRDGLQQCVVVVVAHIVFAYITALGTTIMEAQLGTMHKFAIALQMSPLG